MLHITATRQQDDGLYLWHCRCGVTSGDHRDRDDARRAGDLHLLVGNDNKAEA